MSRPAQNLTPSPTHARSGRCKFSRPDASIRITYSAVPSQASSCHETARCCPLTKVNSWPASWRSGPPAPTVKRCACAHAHARAAGFPGPSPCRWLRGPNSARPRRAMRPARRPRAGPPASLPAGGPVRLTCPLRAAVGSRGYAKPPPADGLATGRVSGRRRRRGGRGRRSIRTGGLRCCGTRTRAARSSPCTTCAGEAPRSRGAPSRWQSDRQAGWQAGGVIGRLAGRQREHAAHPCAMLDSESRCQAARAAGPGPLRGCRGAESMRSACIARRNGRHRQTQRTEPIDARSGREQSPQLLAEAKRGDLCPNSRSCPCQSWPARILGEWEGGG